MELLPNPVNLSLGLKAICPFLMPMHLLIPCRDHIAFPHGLPVFAVSPLNPLYTSQSDQSPFFLFFFLLEAGHVGSYFPDEGLNPSALHWKLRVLTIELRRGSPFVTIFNIRSTNVEGVPGGASR